MKKAKIILAILLVVVMSFTMLACNNDDAGSSGGEGTGTGTGEGTGTGTGTGSGDGEKEWVSYTIGNSAWLGRFLAGLSPSESMTACDGVFDYITRINMTTREYESDVLTDFGFKDDTTFYMVLRDDVYFSNGDKATAEDLYFSYWNHPERGSNWLQNHGIIWDQSGPVDGLRVEFALERPYPAFHQRGIALVNKSWSEEVGWESMDWYDPVGSGPYYVHEYVNDSHIVLRTRESRGETYWNTGRGPIHVDEWIMKYYPDPTALYMALQVGEVDYADIAGVDYERYLDGGANIPNVELRAVQAGSVAYFMFGFQDHDLWFNKDLRLAVAHGVNWANVGQAAMGGGYIEALSTASKICADYIEVGSYEFNQDRARSLMEGAGYGPNNRLSLYTVTMSGDFYRNAFETIQYFMSQFYIDLEVDFLDNAGAIAAWLGEGDTDVGSWYAFSGSPVGDYATSINEIRPFTGLTWTGVQDDVVIDNYNILTGSSDPAARSQATKTIQQRLYDEVLWIPFCEWMLYYGWRTDKFTEEQVLAHRGAGNYIQVGKWGFATQW